MGTHRWLNIVLAAAAVVAFAVVSLRGQPSERGIEVEPRNPPAGVDEIRVAVTGAVLRPGVVTAAPGDRIGDAIAHAGGATSDADLDAVNLSRRVHDEDQVVVPRLGSRPALLDLNNASAEDLEELPAIGPVYASAIVEARTARGPFVSTDQLVELGVVPERTYQRIRDLVTVR